MGRVSNLDNNVQSPVYYKFNIEGVEYELIDIIREFIAGLEAEEAFIVGNIVKYLYRFNKKDGGKNAISDIKKIQRYTELLLELKKD